MYIIDKLLYAMNHKVYFSAEKLRSMDQKITFSNIHGLQQKLLFPI